LSLVWSSQVLEDRRRVEKAQAALAVEDLAALDLCQTLGRDRHPAGRAGARDHLAHGWRLALHDAVVDSHVVFGDLLRKDLAAHDHARPLLAQGGEPALELGLGGREVGARLLERLLGLAERAPHALDALLEPVAVRLTVLDAPPDGLQLALRGLGLAAVLGLRALALGLGKRFVPRGEVLLLGGQQTLGVEQRASLPFHEILQTLDGLTPLLELLRDPPQSVVDGPRFRIDLGQLDECPELLAHAQSFPAAGP
jgi:hypothetical protein